MRYKVCNKNYLARREKYLAFRKKFLGESKKSLGTRLAWPIFSLDEAVDGSHLYALHYRAYA